MAVICFCGLNRRGIVPRIVSCALDVALVRGLIAFVAFRRAKWSASPVTKRTLASIMAVLAAGSILHALLVLIHPGPDDLFHADLIHILPTLLQMIQICTIGIGLFILIAHRLIVQSQEESLHDPLSGTLNRRGIETRLTRELDSPNLTRKKLFVALIDLDNFKAINDSHGHRTGDAVLRTVAQTITAQLRATDYFGRYGGDEFLLLLNRVSCEEAVAVANRLNETVNSLHTSRIVAADITLSIGITEIIPTDDTISLVERADQALYRAKRDGRNCVRVVPPTAPDHADSPTPGLTT
jgi:diguanylate cyclase (GGDEF)-like protein